MTSVPRDPTHVIKLQTVSILMVHLNANAKRMAFLGIGKHVQVSDKKSLCTCVLKVDAKDFLGMGNVHRYLDNVILLRANSNTKRR